MSTVVMGLCWPIQIPPTAKAVLMSLADQSNDQGSCWPSLPGIVTRTCFGRTAVIEAIKWLEDAGYLSIERVGGRTNRYSLHLNRLRQQEIEPVRQPDQSVSRTGPSPALLPVRQADEPVRQADPNRQEPLKKKKAPPPPCVEVAVLVEAGFDEATAVEFIAHKDRLKAPLTERAWKDHQREAAKAGWSVLDAAIKVMAKHWKGFEAKYVATEPRRMGAPGAQGMTVPPIETIEQYQRRMAAERDADRKRATPPPVDLLMKARGAIKTVGAA